MVVLVTSKNEEDSVKRMKKIQSKMNALEWPQHQMLVLDTQRHIRNSVAGVGSCRNSNSFMHSCMSLLPAKNEEDPFKVAITFLPSEVYGDFSRRSMAGNSAISVPVLAKFRTHPRLYDC